MRRGAVVESIHRGRGAICNPEGEVLENFGDPEGYAYVRSAIKPIQALPLVLSGTATDFGITGEELAVACASHSGEERHLSAVRSILRKAGLGGDDLQNGAHLPYSTASAALLQKKGESPQAIHGNCSGKHAGMLAVCVHEGWSTENYRDPDHPLQLWVLDLLSEVCGLEKDEILLAVDGCGVPTFAMPLKSLATGFARIASGKKLSAGLDEAAGRIREAMWLNPRMVAGKGRLDTLLIQETGLLAKSGAEGMFACGSREGWGMAVKVTDGRNRAIRPAIQPLLARQGVRIPAELESLDVKNLRGELVGVLEHLL